VVRVPVLYVLRVAAVVEYVPSDNDAMDNAVLQQWTRNRVLSPTPSAVATRRRNHHRRVDHLHSTFHYTNSLLSQCCVLCADVNGDNVVGQ